MVNDNSLLDLMKDRRSVRQFSGEKISANDISSIIEAAIWAPTGCNNQELRYYIISDGDELNKIISFKPFFKGVSTIILVFCDMSLPMSHKMYCELKHEKNLPYIDTGLALANMMLYAKSNGIDSCIFNLSEYHFKSDIKLNLIKKIGRFINLKTNRHSATEGNFEFHLRNDFKIPSYLKIMCGIAFGYADKYPDVSKARHGCGKIMRDETNHYIIKTNK